MPQFRLRVAWREHRGLVRAPVRDEPVQAATVREAIGAVLGDAETLLSDATNFAWLCDEEGNLVWTLRMDEFSARST